MPFHFYYAHFPWALWLSKTRLGLLLLDVSASLGREQTGPEKVKIQSMMRESAREKAISWIRQRRDNMSSYARAKTLAKADGVPVGHIVKPNEVTPTISWNLFAKLSLWRMERIGPPESPWKKIINSLAWGYDFERTLQTALVSPSAHTIASVISAPPCWKRLWQTASSTIVMFACNTK